MSVPLSLQASGRGALNLSALSAVLKAWCLSTSKAAGLHLLRRSPSLRQRLERLLQTQTRHRAVVVQMDKALQRKREEMQGQ